MKIPDLSQFGLDSNQSKTYLAMLENGPSSILEISKKSGVNRSMLYAIMDSLTAAGLAYRSVRGKKARFVAREPEGLRSLLETRFQQFEKLLPDLKNLASEGSSRPVISMHEGLDGIKQVYLGAAQAKEKALYAFVGVESLLSKTNILEQFWDHEFKEERKKHNVFGRLIVPNNSAGHLFQEKDNKNFRESKLVSAELYNFPAEVLLYDDMAVFISCTQHEEYAIEVKSRAISGTLKMIWGLVWGSV